MNSIADYFDPQTPFPVFSSNPLIHNLIERCQKVLGYRTFDELHRLARLLDHILSEHSKSAHTHFTKTTHTLIQRLVAAQQSRKLPSDYQLADPTWPELFAVIALAMLVEHQQRQNRPRHFLDGQPRHGFGDDNSPFYGRQIFFKDPDLLDAATLVNLAENFNSGFMKHADYETVAAIRLKIDPFREWIKRVYWKFYVEQGYDNKEQAAKDFLALQSDETKWALTPTKNEQSAADILNKYLTDHGVRSKPGRKRIKENSVTLVPETPSESTAPGPTG
jgi:hypothetical protein